MSHENPYRLFNAFLLLVLMAAVASLIAVQWRHQALPFAAILVVLSIALLKARLIVLDFLGLRGLKSPQATALLAWPAGFALAAAAKTLAVTLLIGAG